MKIISAVFLTLALSACAGNSARLQSFLEQRPINLLAEVDREIYSPVRHGLKKMEADILVDVSGFYPSASRPEKPVLLPVRFVWNQGQATFAAGNWPPSAAPLRKQVLALLEGKEGDIIHAPFTQRFEGYRLTLEESGDNLVVIAKRGGAEGQTWRLTINGKLLISEMNAQIGDRDIASEITYKRENPALIGRIDSTYLLGKQKTMVQVEYSYGKAGGFVLPDEIVYRTMIDRAEYPPLTLQIRNVKVNQ